MVKRLGHIIRFIFARFKWYRKSCGGRWAKVTGYPWGKRWVTDCERKQVMNGYSALFTRRLTNGEH